MPSIEIGPKGLQPARAVGAVDPRKGPATQPGNDRSAEVANANSAVVRSRELDPGQPPVDADRVAEIRKAIEQGTYPIVPAKVADAMIAAGLLLRTGK
ncbi:MAG: flagellar biosynthesis anti-sigma factor FlgM [Sphingomonadaceae bacterium]|nr:flagellar biosynthesis anti-sigma factor FlgM [Sphingomonadaceae bacterium]